MNTGPEEDYVVSAKNWRGRLEEAMIIYWRLIAPSTAQGHIGALEAFEEEEEEEEEEEKEEENCFCLLKAYSTANRTGSPQGFHKFKSYNVA